MAHFEPVQLSVARLVLHARPHPPQLPVSFVVLTQVAFAPLLHRVGRAGFAQA
jgi:hypothetical protein